MAEAIVEKTVEGKKVRYKVVEFRVDGNNTVKRTLVPVDTSEEDIPVGASLLDENETSGLLIKQGKPEKLLVGDMVKLRSNAEQTGSITGKLRSGNFNVRWSSGEIGRYSAEELKKVY